MKIVHIITRLIVGGAQENTLLTCQGLHERGHDVTLITGPTYGPEGQLVGHAKNAGYRYLELPYLRRSINPLHDALALRRLKKELAALDPDIVHTHSAKAGIIGRYAAHSLRQQSAEACCAGMRALQTAQLNACGRPRIIHTIHGLAFHPYQSNLVNRLYIAVERRAAGRTDAFISVADAMTAQALAAGIGRDAQYHTIRSGLEVDTFLTRPPAEQTAALRRQLNLPGDAVVIVTVARLFHLKGHEFVVEAARRLAGDHPNVYWLFVGDGSLRPDIERQIAQANLADRFRLTGLVPPARIPEFLHASDVLVHCSLREGLARTLPQALLAGLPVVSFDVDGAREVVFNDQTGFLVPPRNIDALTAALGQLIDQGDLRRRLGQTGRKRCQRDFDHHLMVDQILTLYHQQLPLAIGTT